MSKIYRAIARQRDGRLAYQGQTATRVLADHPLRRVDAALHGQ